MVDRNDTFGVMGRAPTIERPPLHHLDATEAIAAAVEVEIIGVGGIVGSGTIAGLTACHHPARCRMYPPATALNNEHTAPVSKFKHLATLNFSQ